MPFLFLAFLKGLTYNSFIGEKYSAGDGDLINVVSGGVAFEKVQLHSTNSSLDYGIFPLLSISYIRRIA